VPGYWAAVYLIETRLGRRGLQLLGFLLLGTLYIVMAAAYAKIKEMYWIFFSLYALSFFITNAGPNTTTYVLAAESFPTEIRATYHGISAACGKLGAAFGAAAMVNVLESWGLAMVFFICGVVALAGAVVTFFCVEETRGRSLEALSIGGPQMVEQLEPELHELREFATDDYDDDYDDERLFAQARCTGLFITFLLLVALLLMAQNGMWRL